MKKRTLSLLLAVACALSLALSGCGGAPAPDAQTSAPAGSVVEADKNGLAIACGDGRLLRVLELPPPATSAPASRTPTTPPCPWACGSP